MSLLVACLGSGTDSTLNKILHSKLFTQTYLISESKGHTLPPIDGIRLEFIQIIDKPVEEMVSDLYVILKQKFHSEKIQELDIAVNISSGTGKEHAVILSTLMKLGYGIRLIELDKEGNILEMV